MTDNGDRAPTRVPSGVTGLDTILNGGFLKNSVNLIEGTPRTGKTILGNQIAYNHVTRGGRALFVTLLAETHSRLLLHLESMRFFDPSRIPQNISYISAFQALQERGLKELVALLRREIQGQGATILVLDGLVAAQQSATSEIEFKMFVQDLQAQATLGDCTIFLLSTDKSGVSPEHTMVDGLIELRDELFEARSERALEVRKLRGSRYLRGRHSFRITDEGLTVFPRLEAVYGRPSHRTEPPQERLATGIDALDAMLGGGLPAATTTAIFGPSGTGKTTFGLHFLSPSNRAEPGLFFGFFETPERLKAQAAAMGLGFVSAMERGDVEIIWRPPTEGIMDELGHGLLDAVRRRGVRRLFVDGLGGFIEPVTQPGRITRYFAALANELRGLDVTTVYTLETRDLISSKVQVPLNGISSLVENLIALRYVEYRARIHRLLSVLKMRSSRFDTDLREFVIGDNGVTIADTFESALQLLTGSAVPADEASSARPKQSRRRRSED
jgi:circadian clock protein KaiC